MHRSELSSLNSKSDLEQARAELLTSTHKFGKSVSRLGRNYAWLVFGSAVLGTLLAIIGFDAFLQSDETGVRLIASLLFLGVIAYSAYRWLVPALTFSPTVEDVANWVEKRQPETGEGLATAIQLSASDVSDRRFGSPEFQESAIRGWMDTNQEPDWDSLVDLTLVWRSLAMFACVAGICGLAVLIWPHGSWVGLKRVAMPWSNVPWPREDRLEFYDLPSAVAYGSDLQIEVTDRNPPLPKEIDILVRELVASSKDGSKAFIGEITVPANTLGEVAVASLNSLERPIEVKAVGGDDVGTDWVRIDVVQPPEIVSSAFLIVPPAYSRQAEAEVSATQVRVLKSSTVSMSGQLSEPLQAISLKRIGKENEGIKEKKARETEQGGKWQVGLSSDGKSFWIGANSEQGVVAELSTAWQIQVVTSAGLEVLLPKLWNVEVVADQPPQVATREPITSDLSPSARIPVVGIASDDLELVEVALNVSPKMRLKKESSVDQIVRKEIWRSNSGTQVQSVDVEQMAELPSQLGLQEGDQVNLWLEATDSLGQVGTSQPIVFSLKGEDALLAGMEPQRRKIMDQLREVTEAQGRNQGLARKAASNLERTQELTSDDVEDLSSVAQIQDSILNEVSQSPSSLVKSIERLQATLSFNDLSPSESDLKLAELGEKLRDVAQGSASDALEKAREAERSARNELESEAAQLSSSVVKATQKAVDSQSRVLSDLRSLLQDLDRAEAAESIKRELTQALEDQRQILGETQRLQVESIGDSSTDNVAAKQDLLSVEQSDLSRSLEDTIDRSQASGSEGEQGKAAAGAVNSIAASGVSKLMRESSRQLRNGDFSEAISSQQEAISALEKSLAEAGIGGAQNGFAERAKELAGTSREVEALALAQKKLASTIQESEVSEADLLSRQQAELVARTETLSSELDVAGDWQTAGAMLDAVELQAGAIDFLAARDLQQASSLAAEAADILASAAETAMQRAKQMENEAKEQSKFELAEALTQVVNAQEQILNSLSPFLKNAPSESDFSDRDRDELRNLAGDQQLVKQRLGEISRRTVDLPAFSWVLETAEADMRRAVAALQRFRVQPEAEESATSALEKLSLAIEAIESSAQNQANEEQPIDSDATNSSAREQGSESRLASALASLKLLRSVQAKLNFRTSKAQQLPASDPRRDPMLDRLAEEQLVLGDKLKELADELSTSGDSQ